MKSLLRIIIIFCVFQSARLSGQNSGISACTGYEMDGPKTVIFSCEGGEKLSLEFLDSGNIKFWFTGTGEFERANESFAVIHEDFDPDFEVKVKAHPSNFEIFTDELRVVVQKQPLTVRIFDKYQRLLFGDPESGGYFFHDGAVETRKILRADEQFFGLGEKTGPLNRRGRTFTMWNSDKPCYSDTEDPLYKSIPFFMSSYNYGIFLDNTYKTRFDFGASSEEYFSFSAPGGAFVFYFMYGSDLKEVLYSYTRLTGKPIMPPKWAFGWAQSRGMLVNEELTRKIAAEYRERDIPIDIIYQDIGWVDGLQNFDWRKDRYEDAEKMLSDLAKDGFKVIVSQDPVISQATEDQWKEAASKGYFVEDVRTGKPYDMPWPWGGNAGVVDFTDPEVANWWGELQQKPLNDGVMGFWTDMGEPAWSNEVNTDRLYMQHEKGMHAEIHNVYGLEWDRVVTEQFEKRNPNQRVFQMTRAAYAGVQRYAFGWSGDSGNGSDVTQGWDNLADQVSLGLSAGLGLIPFWTTDISGYCGEIKDYAAFSELYVRWLQFGIFNPLSRAHHEGNNAVEPWLFGQEAERIAKKAIELKYKLHPYIYTYAREAYDKGLPIMRPLFLEYPNDEKTFAINDQFLFGEELLVAPVVEEGVAYREVYLPKGQWRDYHKPSRLYRGGKVITYDTPLDVIPIFVKVGAIIPKMPVMPYIGAKKNAPLILEVFPAAKTTTFELYEDEGTNNDYRNGHFSKTKISSSMTSSKIVVTLDPPVEKNFRVKDKRNIWAEVFMEEAPGEVLLNGEKLRKFDEDSLRKDRSTAFDLRGYFYDAEQDRVLVRFPDLKRLEVITIIK